MCILFVDVFDFIEIPICSLYTTNSGLSSTFKAWLLFYKSSLYVSSSKFMSCSVESIIDRRKRDAQLSLHTLPLEITLSPNYPPPQSLPQTKTMAAEAPDPKTFGSWEEAFQYPIPAVRGMERQLRRDIDSNREKLRTLVGYGTTSIYFNFHETSINIPLANVSVIVQRKLS